MINEAIDNYNFINYKSEFIRHNENITYKICDDNGSYVLRIHKPIDGYNIGLLRMGKDTNEFVDGEIKVLEYLSKNSEIGTQKVLKNKNGNSITVLENGTLVTVLKWIEGTTLENIDITDKIAFETGIMLATLHNNMRNIKFSNRYNYDETLLSKMIEETQVAQLKNHFSQKQAQIIRRTLLYTLDYMSNSKNKPIFVHADISKSNLIYSNGKIVPIDFSLSGYCLPEMDLASLFCHFNNKKCNNILNGYLSSIETKIDIVGIKTFICFQILLFLLCQHNHIANAPWFPVKLNEWCDNYFSCLISGKEIPNFIGLYQ